MADAKINVYKEADLKSTTDDALGNYLRGLAFKEDNTKIDIRLAIGYVAVLLSLGLFAADWQYGWEATKNYNVPVVAAYTLLNGAFTYCLWFWEKGLVFEGVKDGVKVGSISLKGHESSQCANGSSSRSPFLPRRRSTTQRTTSP